MEMGGCRGGVVWVGKRRAGVAGRRGARMSPRQVKPAGLCLIQFAALWLRARARLIGRRSSRLLCVCVFANFAERSLLASGVTSERHH